MKTDKEELFYEIEYDSTPFPGVGKFVQKPKSGQLPENSVGKFVMKLKSERIKEPEKDEVRELFGRMRDIAREQRKTYDFSRFFDRSVQNEEVTIFYQQGLFMKDFTDDYEGTKQFMQYFPCYQRMGYEQLRTYFTWRTKVRQGHVTGTSLSYAFLYIYELLGNIGVTDPADGLDKLMFFWKKFRVFNKIIDKYVRAWLKDYFIYYRLPHTFKDFVETNDLAAYYPNLTETDNSFDLFCAISKYKIKKSIFYNDETSQMIDHCFSFVLKRIRQEFETAGMNFDDALFRPTRKIAQWKPFKNALFCDWIKQADRRVVLSPDEIYLCQDNVWTSSTKPTTEKGRQFISYVMKQMESVLRKITKYKFKLTANTNMINEDTVRVLTKAGISIEKVVVTAVLEYHREATKTIVKVDHTSLARIRREALDTQEALIVEEQEKQQNGEADQGISSAQQQDGGQSSALFTEQDQNIFADATEEATVTPSIWDNLKEALSNEEIKALAVALSGEDMKAFADACGIMVEVLVDGINEKAMDYVGDNLLDEDFILYEDYKDQMEELIK